MYREKYTKKALRPAGLADMNRPDTQTIGENLTAVEQHGERGECCFSVAKELFRWPKRNQTAAGVRLMTAGNQ